MYHQLNNEMILTILISNNLIITNMFFSINLVKNSTDIINRFPIIFENNLNDIDFIDQIKDSFTFKDYIRKNVHFSYFNNIEMFSCYIVNNDSQFYYESSYKISELFNIFDIYSWEDFVKDELKNLYETSLKRKPNDNISDMYNDLKQRFPNKINKMVVINYICSQLKEKYNDITNDQLLFLQNNFNSNIKDDTDKI